MSEQWVPVHGLESFYEVSSDGQIRRIGRVAGAVVGRVIRQSTNKAGYKRVGLWANGECRLLYVHRIVAASFLGPSELDVNHINGDKSDNRIANLEYVTKSQNMRHAADVIKTISGPSAPLAKLSVSDVEELRAIHRSGVSAYAIARRFGIHHSTAWRIATRQTWKHVA